MTDQSKDKYDILCIGACVQDILIRGMKPESFENTVTSLEETVFTSGGDAANEAVVLSRLGSRTALAAKIDTGVVGDALYRELMGEGIDTTYLVRDPDSRSTTAFIALGDEGHHTFFLARGKREGITLEEIDLAALNQVRAVSFGSLYTSYQLDQGGFETIAKAVKGFGGLTFADVDYDVRGLGARAMDDLFPYLDYLLPSIDEARYITGERQERAAARILLDKGVGTVVIKLGDQGCYVKSRDQEFYVDPFPVEAKDTTGCGDNFAAGFIHCVLAGQSLAESARFGCAAGAINAREIGGHMAVRSQSQVEQFIRRTRQKPIRRL